MPYGRERVTQSPAGRCALGLDPYSIRPGQVGGSDTGLTSGALGGRTVILALEPLGQGELRPPGLSRLWPEQRPKCCKLGDRIGYEAGVPAYALGSILLVDEPFPVEEIDLLQGHGLVRKEQHRA